MSIPIFIIAFNRLSALQESIQSYLPFARYEDIVIVDRGSDYPPLLEYYRNLQALGVSIRHAPPVSDADSLNAIAEVVEAEKQHRRFDFYVVTDPDIAFVNARPDTLELYAAFLTANPGIDIIGPMLTIIDIPATYPARESCWKRHSEQFWHKSPEKATWQNEPIYYQQAFIDTTFGLLRASTRFRRLLSGVRLYAPYEARHLDWYVTPDNIADDHRYYMQTANNRVAHWCSDWYNHPPQESLAAENRWIFTVDREIDADSRESFHPARHFLPLPGETLSDAPLTPPGGIDPLYQWQPEDRYYHRPQSTDFGYKDAGDAENRLYALMRGAQDRQVFSAELMSKATDWVSLYHLTPLRANLMRPFAERLASGSTLELGAGCGAVTRYLGEQGGKVVALEGSPSRARIIGQRCRDLSNVTVVADLIQDFACTEKFDTVTLIGVLEYAQVYIDDPNPVQRLLAIAKSFLKPDGVLIVAIENQLGLKYFCGAAEDHLGRPMIGINDSYTDKSPITFGRKALTQEFQRAGFQAIDLYVPVPDYKMPVSIIYPAGFDPAAETAGWDVSPLLAGSAVHDYQRPGAPAFSLECAWSVVGRNGLGQDLANSFLFALRESTPLPAGNVLAAHYGCQRPAQFAKETRFVFEAGALVTQTRLFSQPAEQPWEIAPYRPGILWFDELLRLMNRPQWTLAQLSQWAALWLLTLRQAPKQAPSAAIAELRHLPELLPANYVDATPTNLVIGAGGRGKFFDLEWNFGTALPLSFVVMRGFFLTLHRVTSCARPAAEVPTQLFELTSCVMETLGVPLPEADMDLYLTLFNTFQNQAMGLPADAMNGLTAQLDKAQLPIRQLFT